MKARYLRKLLNNTGYTVTNHKEYIAIGSSMVHDLIRVQKDNFRVSYALDTWREGRSALKSAELEFIWDRLHELILSNELTDIINGDDVLENPLPVYYVERGELKETFTDKYGWPNVTISGEQMYDNTHFKSKKKALNAGLREVDAACRSYWELIKQREEELQKMHDRYNRYVLERQKLQSIKL